MDPKKLYNTPAPDELVPAADLHSHVEAVKQTRLAERQQAEQNWHDEERKVYRAFLDRKFTESDRQEVMTLTRRAVHAGKFEVEIARFPSWYLSDHGQAINNDDPNWPNSLTGYAANCYQAFTELVQPLGYKMVAKILDYPNGMIGTVALYLRW